MTRNCPALRPFCPIAPVLAAFLALAAPFAAAQDAMPEPAIPEAAPHAAAPAAPRAPAAEVPGVDVPSWHVFASPEQGLSLELPPGRLQMPHRDGRSTDLLAIVINDERGWVMEVRQIALQSGMNLASEELAQGGRRTGLFDSLAAAAVADFGGEMLRKDLAPLGEADAGVFALRHAAGPRTLLRQTGVIRGADTRFWTVTLVSPAPEGDLEALAADAGVQGAVEAFNRTFNSFRRLDQTQIRQDQEDRLVRTRALFVNITQPRLRGALQERQWWRYRKDGHDIGYALVVEEVADGLTGRGIAAGEVGHLGQGGQGAVAGRGVRVGVKSMFLTPSGRLDRESWMFTDDGRDAGRFVGWREEMFSEQNRLRPDAEREAGRQAGQQAGSEALVVGTMRYRQVPRRTTVPGPGGLGQQSVIDIVDDRRLEVTFSLGGGTSGDPLVRELPAWYVPQALDHLMPRLAAQFGPASYLLAVYVPDRREVWQRYVDVRGEQLVEIDGQRTEAIVVETRLGLSGAVTRHFVEPRTFRYLGALNLETGVEVIVTDEATLRRIWESGEVDRALSDADAAGK